MSDIHIHINRPTGYYIGQVRRHGARRWQDVTGRREIPVGRIAAKLLERPAFTVEPNEASALFSKLCRHQMVTGLTFHDARATALTLLAKKVDVMVLARISGHRDISLLHRVYFRASADEIAAQL